MNPEGEWQDRGQIYSVLLHVPCGTEVPVLMGQVAICPKCQPEQWAKGHFAAIGVVTDLIPGVLTRAGSQTRT